MLSSDVVNIMGLVAAFSAVMFLPQVLHTWRNRSARDVSGVMLAVASTSMVL